MIHKINTSQVCSTDKGNLVTEASTLGLKPGEWPDFIALVNDEDEGFLFQKGASNHSFTNRGTSNEEIHFDGFDYFLTTGNGKLIVFND